MQQSKTAFSSPVRASQKLGLSVWGDVKYRNGATHAKAFCSHPSGNTRAVIVTANEGAWLPVVQRYCQLQSVTTLHQTPQ